MVTLSVSLLVGSISSAPRGDMLVQLLRSEVDPKENEVRRFCAVTFNVNAGKMCVGYRRNAFQSCKNFFSLKLQDLSGLLFLKHLFESGTPEEKDVITSIDDLDVRNEVVRELPLSQRERKAGCRNFYWKTFTSC